MAEKIEFDLKVGVNELQKALSDATTGSKKLGDTISTALGVVGGNLATKAFSSLGSAIGATTDFLKDSVKAAQEQEDALNKLSQALRNTGEFSAQAVEDFSQFASELQKASVFGDEVVIGQIAIAKSLGATNEQAKALVTAAANLSAALGGSLEENVFKLGKTLSGVASRDLVKVIPALRGLSEEALRSGAALDIVNQKFSGSAASQLDTFSGSTTALGNSFSDLQEEIGTFVTSSKTLNEIIDLSSSAVQSVTGFISNYREEQARANGTIVETTGSLGRLKEKYTEIAEDIKVAQDIVNNPSVFDKLLARPLAAAENLKVLQKELDVVSEQIKKATEQVESAKAVVPRVAVDTSTAEELNKIKQFEAEKNLITNQAELERQDFQAQLASVGIENEIAKQEAEIQRILEFETQKKELEFQFAEEKASIIQDKALQQAELTKIGKERELEFNRIANKAILEEEKLKQKKQQDSIFAFRKYEDLTNKERIQNLQSTLGTIATLSDSGNRTLAAIGKAAAISNATIDGYAAVQKALASAPPPLNYGLAAAVGAATAANVAKIAGVKFQDGGIVGASNGPDNQLAAIRTGEMVLNADQQKRLFDMVNSGSMGGEIVIQIDGREIARAIRNQERSGYSFA